MRAVSAIMKSVSKLSQVNSMASLFVLLAFVAALFVCIASGASILYALVFGLLLFFAYGLYRGHRFKTVLDAALSGVRSIRHILFTFVLIGMLTALWRAAGVIPTIVCHAAALLHPRAMLLITFLLCSLVSFLTGTSFGTAATMGIICITVANAMDIPPLYTGGAILSGAFFGDRCSPMSTSALLVATLTKTDLYKNIVNMMKTALVPFVLTCIFYALLGGRFDGSFDAAPMRALFFENFSLHPLSLLPAAAVIVLSLFRINVRITMGVSIALSFLLGVFFEGIAPAELLKDALLGFHPTDASLARLVSGGGIVSMVRVAVIVGLSACYSGLFRLTGLLDGIRAPLQRIKTRFGSFIAVLSASIVTSMIGCNQSLAAMLTHQITEPLVDDPYEMASILENTVIVIAALVPWSIAGAAALETVGAPLTAIPFAFYLYCIPICNAVFALYKRHR